MSLNYHQDCFTLIERKYLFNFQWINTIFGKILFNFQSKFVSLDDVIEKILIYRYNLIFQRVNVIEYLQNVLVWSGVLAK